MVLNWQGRAAFGLVLAGVFSSAALADGGGGAERGEESRKKAGLESREQGKDGYLSLSEAAFILVFDETAEIRYGLFGRDHPRHVTGFDTVSENVSDWAWRRYRKYWRQNDGKSDSEPKDPAVRVQAVPQNAADKAAFAAWSRVQEAGLRALQVYRPNLLHTTEASAQTGSENTEGSLLSQLLSGAVGAVEEAADTKIVFENAQKQPDDATANGAGVRVSGGHSLWDADRWQRQDWKAAAMPYYGGLDAVTSLKTVPAAGVSFEEDVPAAFPANDQLSNLPNRYADMGLLISAYLENGGVVPASALPVDATRDDKKFWISSVFGWDF